MSVSVTISGEIIESQTYLSNYFVTLTGDQTIYGSNTFNQSLNVKSLNFTRQLRDYLSHAQSNNLDMILYTRPNTVMSGPLRQAINNNSIIHKYLPK
jgi:hypothetical protein